MKNNLKPTLAIIDADMFVFLAGWAYNDQLTPLGAMAAKKQLDKLIEAVLKKVDADYYVGFFGKNGAQNFRYDVATIKPYKGNRKSPPWQEYFKPILKQHFIDKWKFYPMADIEADDAVIIAHHQYVNDYNIIHVGEDKDFKQLGDYRRWNPKKKVFETMTMDEGRKFFWKQMLIGDSSDNIGGVQGVGAASKYVSEIDSFENPTEATLYEFVQSIYASKYEDNWEPIMVENYLLLNMLTTPRFDYPKKIELVPLNKEQMYTTPDIIDI